VTRLRVGTRGSELALWQANWVCDRLREKHSSLEITRVIIKTQGDALRDKRFDQDWPVGAFTSAIENALLEEHIDFAVHSHKDLQTSPTAGLVIAAVPPGFKIGTGSPRRSAQLRRLGDVKVVPIRGNVPTRVAQLKRENLDGVVLAAAGLLRLGIDHKPRIDLPTGRFVPAPAQGALAVQAREDSEAAEIIEFLDDAPSRQAVEAERSFLSGINAGCHTPAAALATVDGPIISLHAQLFSDDAEQMVETMEAGKDAKAIGLSAAKRLLRELGRVS
jgi:hydroxymethylbilane synthase